MRSKITLKELAKILNVSVSTVSKSLNDSSEISPKTIQRVKELAQLHNYRPNPTAVNLKSNRSGNIAVIVPNISNTFFAKVLGGVETAARKQGFQVITYISNESLKLEQQIVELISNGIVDGLLISVSEETQQQQDYEHLHRLMEYEIPVVLYDRVVEGLEIDSVGVNDRVSIYEAVKFLHSQNRKKVAVVSGLGEIGLGKNRIDGYVDASRDLDLPYDKKFVITSKDKSVIKKKLNKILKEDKVDALIGFDYLSTLLCSRVAQENNLSIPGDIMIIGYANEDFAPFLWPSLSYVDQHPAEMGETAANMLVQRIKEPSVKKSVRTVINTELRHLDSTQ